MNGETAFFALLIGCIALVCVGAGLVISAFIGKKITKSGIIRAIIGGVFIAAAAVFCIVIIR